jgi:hypothetical protein
VSTASGPQDARVQCANAHRRGGDGGPRCAISQPWLTGGKQTSVTLSISLASRWQLLLDEHRFTASGFGPQSAHLEQRVRGLAMRCMWAALGLMALTFIAPGPAVADDIAWFSTPLGATTISHERSQYTHRATYLAIVGPEVPPGSRYARTRECAQQHAIATKAKLFEIQPRLAHANSTSPRRGNKAEGADQSKAEAAFERVGAALTAATKAFDADFAACLRLEEKTPIAGYYIALLHRDCTEACKGRRNEIIRGKDADRFAEVFTWMAAVQRSATLSTTGWLRLSPSGDRLKVTPEDILSGEGAIADAEAARARLAELVEETRARGRRIGSRGAPPESVRLHFASGLAVGITKNDYVIAADAFIRPLEGYLRAKQGEAVAFAALSNEVARSHILECRYLAGEKGLGDLARCAGYDVDQATLVRCLAELPCTPRLRETASVNAALMAGDFSLKELSTRALLPRNVDVRLDQLIAARNACPRSSEKAVATCVMRATLDADPATRMARACFAQRGDAALSCTIETFATDANRAQLQCGFKRSGREVATCLLEGRLTPGVSKLAACASLAGDKLVACVAEAKAGQSKLAQCLPLRARKYEFAVCMAGRDAELGAALGCLESSQGSSAIAKCAIATKLPRDLAEGISCASQGHADAGATAACVAAAIIDLTPGQQIVMQCLASTGGEPSGLAVCVLGKFTMKELIQCQGRSFSEPGCFGPNNEVQRLAKALTNKTISKSSVVGHIAQGYIKQAELVLPLAEKATAAYDESLPDLELAKDNFDEAVRGNEKAAARLYGQAISAGNPVAAVILKNLPRCC